MKISLKNAGIFVVILSIMCLALIGCFAITLHTNNGQVVVANDENQASSTTALTETEIENIINESKDYKTLATKYNSNFPREIPEVGKTFVMTCDCPDGTPCVCSGMENIWYEAISYSRNSFLSAKVILAKDWIARDYNNITIFGTAHNGFSIDNGRISIPINSSVVLDLNGYNIDRRLSKETATNNGACMVIRGVLVLMDSKFNDTENEQLALDIYEQNKDDENLLLEKLLELDCGKITGGARKGDSWGGGGLVGDASCRIYYLGGIVTNNFSERGGGIVCGGYLTMFNGLVIGNKASAYGGGISQVVGYPRNNALTIKGGIIACDESNNCGGGVYAEQTCNLYGGIIAQNKVVFDNESGGYDYYGYGGGIYIPQSGTLKIYDGTQFYKNYQDNVLNDICLGKNITCIAIAERLTEKSSSMYFDFYKPTYDLFRPFTFGFSHYCNDIEPSKYFLNTNSNIKAKLKDGEVVFDYYAKSPYDFMYNDNGYRKYYKENDLLHSYNDSSISKFVLGKITANTSVNSFLQNISSFEFTDLKIFDSKDNIIYQNGKVESGIIANNGAEYAVGTGWRIEHTINDSTESIYLSVLGDLTGDGKINSADLNYLRQVAKDNSLYSNLVDMPYLQLAMLIENKNTMTNVDCDLLWNVVCGNIDISRYI